MGNYVRVVIGFIPFMSAFAPISQESIHMLVWLSCVPSDVSSDLQK